jgi:hypothetical protein
MQYFLGTCVSLMRTTFTTSYMNSFCGTNFESYMNSLCETETVFRKERDGKVSEGRVVGLGPGRWLSMYAAYIYLLVSIYPHGGERRANGTEWNTQRVHACTHTAGWLLARLGA